jgi:hypothetical protein
MGLILDVYAVIKLFSSVSQLNKIPKIDPYRISPNDSLEQIKFLTESINDEIQKWNNRNKQLHDDSKMWIYIAFVGFLFQFIGAVFSFLGLL